MSTIETLLTADEYGQLPDNGQPTELVRGRIVTMNMPYPRHGQICAEVARLLGNYVRDRSLGRIVANDSGVVTQHDPDTVRGADVAYYSYVRVPKGPLPKRYLGVAPELVLEVRSPEDRWSKLLAKTAEYLGAGVTAVCILDPDAESAHVYRGDQPVRVFAADEPLAFPDILGDFQVVVRRLFE